mgnify:CR=1 FL=1
MISESITKLIPSISSITITTTILSTIINALFIIWELNLRFLNHSLIFVSHIAFFILFSFSHFWFH